MAFNCPRWLQSSAELLFDRSSLSLSLKKETHLLLVSELQFVQGIEMNRNVFIIVIIFIYLNVRLVVFV